jgi:cytochrome c-type biogenesis protein CcmF
MLAALTTVGTLIGPLSGFLLKNRVVVGTEFYNNVLVPVGLVLALTTPTAPLLRWGKPPGQVYSRLLLATSGVLSGLFIAGLCFTDIHPLELAVDLLAIWAVAALLVQILLQSSSRNGGPFVRRLVGALRSNRRQYAGYIIHLGFMMAVVGIAGSSLGVLRYNVDMAEGGRIQFAGYSIFFAGVHETESNGNIVAKTELHISRGEAPPFILRPGQNYYIVDNQWTTEVAVHSTWGRDFYVIAHGGEAGSDASFSFLINPMMRWLWGAGWLCALGAVIRLWPVRQRTAPSRGSSVRLLESRRKPRRLSLRLAKV